MSPTVDLLLSELAPWDATSNHTLILRDLLHEMGAETRIVTQIPSEVCETTLMRRWQPDAHLTIVQHAIGSEIADMVIRSKVPVVVNYHNVTPPEFVEPWQPELISGLRWGLRQLWQLAPITIRGVADSEFNARAMRDAGMGDVVVAPVLWELGVDGSVGGGEVLGDPTLLFVGRVAPNKCHEDLISAFAVVRRLWSGARLVLVGAVSSVGYERALVGLAQRLGVADGVVFAGSVSGDELVRWYERADVFLCLSEHEGFGVPLVEAMGFGVPVVAFGAAAVPETVGDGGLVLGVKDPVSVGLAVDRVLSDGELREVLVDAGRRRAGVFDVANTREQHRAALIDLVSEATASP